MNSESKYIGVVYACITAVLWGFLAIGLKAALQFTDALTVVWFRFTLAFVVLFLGITTEESQAIGADKETTPVAASGRAVSGSQLSWLYDGN